MAEQLCFTPSLVFKVVMFAKETHFPVAVCISLSEGAVGGWSWGTHLGKQLALI